MPDGLRDIPTGARTVQHASVRTRTAMRSAPRWWILGLLLFVGAIGAALALVLWPPGPRGAIGPDGGQGAAITGPELRFGITQYLPKDKVVLAHHEVAAEHLAARRLQRAPGRVAERLALTEHGLRADDAGAAHLLDLTRTVGDHPVARAQRDRAGPRVRDRDRVREDVATFAGRGLVLDVARLHLDDDALGDGPRHDGAVYFGFWRSRSRFCSSFSTSSRT